MGIVGIRLKPAWVNQAFGGKLNPPLSGDSRKKGVACFLLAIGLLATAAAPMLAQVPRYGVDQSNSRRITDPLEETGFPFQKLWEADLDGKVESQPIVCEGRIYVQAGDKLLLLDMEGGIMARSPVLSASPMPSGSSPTFADTPFGERVYQATRDHRLWALDANTLTPLWEEGFVLLAAGGKPDMHYRITASPLAVIMEERVFLALGTGDGDQTGRGEQYADNGFYILEDLGSKCGPVYERQAAGEVTGSHLQSGEIIVATQNILSAGEQEDNLLLCFDLLEGKEIENTPRTPQGIPGSPAEENSRLFIADRQGTMYCYSKHEKEYSLLWTTPPPGAGSSYNLNSPTIGGKYVYLPIRQYQGGGGLLAAYDKAAGSIEAMRAYGSLLCSNVVYWRPSDSEREFLLVYEASGRTQLLDAITLEPVKGFMDGEDRIVSEIMLPHAPAGIKAPEPIIGENHMLLVDGAGILHAYLGRGQDLDLTADLAVMDLQVPAYVEVGEGATWTATVANLTEEPIEQASILWLVDGKVAHHETRDFAAHEGLAVRYAWSGAEKPGAVRAEISIYPPDPVFDTDERNNVRWQYIQVKQPPVKANCAYVRESADWTATYAVLTGYKTRTYRESYVDGEGKTRYRTRSYTDYNSPIYKYVDVEYTEKLTMKMTMYTGQGRLPDPARPLPEDSEGRGAWEIIPYARQKGWDPNLVTRAGAGFTIQVETEYTTDWETKVPSGANAAGGKLSGPEKVTAEFYDTRGKLVKSVPLERTEGAARAGKAIWQLPEERHAYMDGSAAVKRWHFTAVDIPNGEYQILARAEGAGLHALYTCKVGSVRIVGSIYDDIYERIVK